MNQYPTYTGFGSLHREVMDKFSTKLGCCQQLLNLKMRKKAVPMHPKMRTMAQVLLAIPQENPFGCCCTCLLIIFEDQMWDAFGSISGSFYGIMGQ